MTKEGGAFLKMNDAISKGDNESAVSRRQDSFEAKLLQNRLLSEARGLATKF